MQLRMLQPLSSRFTCGIPSLPTQAAQTCAAALASREGPIQAFHGSPGKCKSPTPPWREPWQPFLLNFWDISGSSPSLESTRWDGYRQFCRKRLISASSVVFPAGSRVARKLSVLSPVLLPQELQMASPNTWSLRCFPAWNKLQAVTTLLSLHSATQSPGSFCLESESKKGTQSRTSQNVGKLVLNVWNSLGLASCSKSCIRAIISVSCGRAETRLWKLSRSLPPETCVFTSWVWIDCLILTYD